MKISKLYKYSDFSKVPTIKNHGFLWTVISLVSNVIKKWQQTGMVEVKLRSGRPINLSETTAGRIARKVWLIQEDLADCVAAQNIPLWMNQVKKSFPASSLQNPLSEVSKWTFKQAWHIFRNMRNDEVKTTFFDSNGQTCFGGGQNVQNFIKKITSATVKHGFVWIMLWACVEASDMGNISLLEERTDPIK